MPEVVTCPKCEKKLRVPDDLVGRDVRCPTCGNAFTATVRPAVTPPPPEPAREDDDEPTYRAADKPSRRSSRRDRDDDEDDRPRRRRSRRLEDDDDEEDDDDRPSRRRRRYEPSRGGLTLALGIISILVGVVSLVICAPGIVVGLGLSIPAWVMGQADRRKALQGRIDPSEQGMATAGWICGIAGTVINGLMLLCGLVALVFFGAAMMGGMNQQRRF